MERALLKLNEEDFRLLRAQTQLGRARPGQELVREGQPPPGMFIVHNGSVLLQRRISSYEITSATLGPGEIFGESAFISPTPKRAYSSAVATEETEVIVLSPRRLRPLFDENPGLSGRFFHSIAFTLARRLHAFNEQAGGEGRDRFGRFPSWEIL